MLASSPCCAHARPLACPVMSRPRLGAYRPCLPVLPQVHRARLMVQVLAYLVLATVSTQVRVPQAPQLHPQSRRCQLVTVAAKGKVQKDSLIDGRTVPADNPEARAFQRQTRGSPHKVLNLDAMDTACLPIAGSHRELLQLAVICRTRAAADNLSAQFRRALDAIRGRKYSTALIFMSYLPYRACEKVVTVLKSVRPPCWLLFSYPIPTHVAYLELEVARY